MWGYLCVSHDPALPSDLWHDDVERLSALRSVRSEMATLMGMGEAVTLGPDALWLVTLHPRCEVWLVNEAGEVFGGPPADKPVPSQRTKPEAPAPKDEPTEEPAEPPVAIAPRQRGVGDGPWFCSTHTEREIVKREAMISKAKARKYLCTECFNAEYPEEEAG